ncbi:MAG: hypothetical protein FWB77_02295 [Treponema sp.]|nr:hypothetical protein [Treponema sp.]
MRKPLASRIVGLAALYFLVFCLIVIMQFSNMGNFSISAGSMNIKGRYLAEDSQEITGGIKIFYGGLEFSLKEERGKGLTLTGTNNSSLPVNPELMFLTDNSAHFILPGGTELTFSSIESARGQELQITAEFAGNISDIIIPIVPRRSSLVRDSGQLGILYSGSRYVFSSLGQELENGHLTLSRDSTFITYRSRGKQRAFDPADYIISSVPNYASILRNWQDTNYIQWNQNAANLSNEEDVIAYGSQALARGNYPAASAAITGNFSNSSVQTYRSSVFAGGMLVAHNSFSAAENERTNLVNRLIRERSLSVIKEEHILDFLLTRSSVVQANEVIAMVNNATAEMIVPEYCAGLLEFYYDMRRWRPEASNPIGHLSEQILLLISEILNRDAENDAVYASNPGSTNSEYSMRLGKALIYWADAAQNEEWSGVGRSLVLSAISSGNAGKLHNILKPVDYYPRAVWLTDSGHWTWTVSQTLRAYFNADGNFNISVSFFPNMAHHMIVRGVRPFLRIQIHGMDWRSDNQFERYDSSGWVYYPEDQILIVKLRHRTTTENIRLIYRAEVPPPAPAAAAENGEPASESGDSVE